MTRFIKIFAAGLAISVSGIGAAKAADLVSPELTAPVQPVEIASDGGFYIGSVNSLTFLNDTHFDYGGALFDADTDYKFGYYSALRAGYNFDTAGYVSPRVELELGYGNSPVDHQSLNGVRRSVEASYGNTRTIQGYLNGYLDIPLPMQDGLFSAVTPYVGGGVGFMNMKLKDQGISGIGTLMDDDDTQFAYHLDAGVSIDLQKAGLFTTVSLFDNTKLDVSYRYTAANDFDFTARDGTKSSTDFSSNAVMMGFRKQF